MALEKTDWIFLNGEWKAWDDANVHVTTHALHYGSAAFEGIRAYSTAEGPAIFRLGAHVERLIDSSRILRMELDEYPQERLEQICIESVSRNNLDSCYIRPLVFRGGGTLGLNPLDTPVEVMSFAVKWGRYLGEEAIEQGVDVAISSWRRFDAGTASPLGKIAGQYVTSQFVSIEARQNGFAEGILLDEHGNITEGAGENIFLVLGDEIITPGIASSILAGITRDTVITLARDLGYTVTFAPISRDMLYLGDEMFMTGTAAEISAIRSVDRLPIGKGTRGPVTESLQKVFFDLVEGRSEDKYGWLTHVPAMEAAATS